MPVKKSTSESKRHNSGRKPVEDKKITVCIYPHKSRIDKLGIENVKLIAMKAIEREFNKDIIK